MGGAVAAQTTGADARAAIVAAAKRYVGVPYVYGAESPRAFDCSGFVRYVYREAAGIELPRSSRQIWSAGKAAGLDSAKTGDVLVFDTVGGAPSHVAILMDQGSIIHAVSEGPRTGVIISPLQDRYFGPRIMGARVFVAAATAAPAPKPAPKPAPATAPAAAPKPAPATAAPVPKPSPAPAPAEREPAVSNVGFTITDQPVVFADKIPVAVGSALQYAVTNGTGRDGTFEILFYKMNLDPAKITTIHRERLRIKAGAMVEMAPFVFTEPGQYKLILKTHDNLKRVERVWKVIGE